MSGHMCSKGHKGKPVNGVCSQCLLIAEGHEDRLEHLRAEVLEYCAGYTARGIHAEGAALAKLKKAAEG